MQAVETGLKDDSGFSILTANEGSQVRHLYANVVKMWYQDACDRCPAYAMPIQAGLSCFETCDTMLLLLHD